MDESILTSDIIAKVKKEALDSVHGLMGTDLVEMILYGSCARGDFTKDSDIDIALLTKCDRTEVKKYDDGLDAIATQLAMKYFAVVNFVSLPHNEFLEKNLLCVQRKCMIWLLRRVVHVMSTLQNQITQSLEGLSDDSLSKNHNIAVHEKKRRLGSMKGQKFIADGHDIDENNDEIAELFGMND